MYNKQSLVIFIFFIMSAGCSNKTDRTYSYQGSSGSTASDDGELSNSEDGDNLDNNSTSGASEVAQENNEVWESPQTGAADSTEPTATLLVKSCNRATEGLCTEYEYDSADLNDDNAAFESTLEAVCKENPGAVWGDSCQPAAPYSACKTTNPILEGEEATYGSTQYGNVDQTVCEGDGDSFISG